MQKIQYSSGNVFSRIATASILLPIVVLIIFKTAAYQIYSITGIIWLATYYELLRIFKIKLWWCMVNLALLVILTIHAYYIDFSYIFIAYSSIVILSIILLSYYPLTKKLFTSMVVIFFASIVFASSFISLILVAEKSRIYLLFTCIFVWLADSGAYTHGKLFGKIKLCPHISPGKTWEGCLGACIWTFLLVAITVKFKFNYQVCIFWFIGIIVSIYGDLIESAIKRANNVKDSGNILPGHGGLLDRLDSLLFFLPLSVFGYNYFNIIKC